MKGLQNMSYKHENTPKILLDNKSICVLPWIHTSVKPNSEAKPCCRFQHYLPEHKDIKKVNVIDYKTPQEILNSDAYKTLREKMLRGETIPGCSKCYREEARQGHSMRIGEWANYDSENIVNNNDLKLRYLEVAFGNYCNLACRTCNSELSTNWYEDDVELYKKRNYQDRKPWQKVTDVEYNWSGEELSELVQIKFTGGEPMLHPNFIKFIDILIQSDVAKNITLEIFTNCSWIPKEKILSRLSKFKSLQICMSIDGFGKINDYLRHKSKWETVHASLLAWLDYEKDNDNVQAILSPTISIYNMFDAFELADKYAQYRIARGLSVELKDMKISTAVFPEYVNFRNVADKPKALNYLDKLFNHYVKNFPDKESEWGARHHTVNRMYTKIKNELKNEKKGVHDKFVTFIRDLDELRKQRLRDYIPNLYDYLEECVWENYGKK